MFGLACNALFRKSPEAQFGIGLVPVTSSFLNTLANTWPDNTSGPGLNTDLAPTLHRLMHRRETKEKYTDSHGMTSIYCLASERSVVASGCLNPGNVGTRAPVPLLWSSEGSLRGHSDDALGSHGNHSLDSWLFS
ncbi:hypothetical protein CVT25_008592 [Psilocybe cyanescens]|uniref:Uncharacterized protein n=1 Tax=Psilocybe cyanescens TaxID=93625 RepID=A0A409XNB6_PSICY|nr:hypothetical protein CVT25_008592 [Psilocybe cyanescens]